MDESITNILNECPDCAQFHGRLVDLCTGIGIDGRMTPTVTAVTRFREMHGIRCNVDPRPMVHGTATHGGGNSGNKPWDVSQPSRGVGDTITKITHALGLDKVADFISRKILKKRGCGCSRRAGKLNELIPYSRAA